MKPKPKDRILTHASRLFFKNGFTTGIDTVIRDSKVAKMSLYHHFESKDVLICAVIVEVRTTMNSRLKALEQNSTQAPEQKLIAIFDEICGAFQNPGVRLGLCNQALIQFPEAWHPVNRTVLAFKRWLLVNLERLCAECGNTGDRKLMAARLMLLAEGCYGLSAVLGIDRCLALTHELALQVIMTPLLETNNQPLPCQ